MNRRELVQVTARKLGRGAFITERRDENGTAYETYMSTAEVVDKVLGALMEAVTLSLGADEEVMIRTFGKFDIRTKPAVKRVNPKTGEVMDIPERRTAVFIPSSNMKDRLNGRSAK